jgi:hypothetical protein
MNKQELLREISTRVDSGEISREEVASVVGVSQMNTNPDSDEANKKYLKHFSMTKMLYVLGAAIVVIGVVIFAAQIWDDIGAFGRILITLGFGLLFTASGVVLSRTKPGDVIGSVFYAIGGLLIPGGSMVTLYEVFSFDLASLWPVVFTFGGIFLFYLLLNLTLRNIVLTLFSVFNGTAFVYFLVSAMLEGALYRHGDIYAYLTMVVGLAYMLLAYSFKDGWNRKLSGVLYFLGSVGFLGAGFSRVFESELWQMFYFLLVIGGLFLSAHIRNRGVLVASTLFLIAHVSYITSEYFADSLGWPISLIILGFVFIGLGYISITINKKYIKE